LPDSAAAKAGIKDKDIILEVNNKKITEQDTLLEIIQGYNAGETITMKILSDSKEKTIKVTLGERIE